MSWEKIIGHDRVKKILQHAIIDNKVASGYLFTGMEGIGKDALAIEFAKTLNCLNPIIDGYEINACDTCKSCKQFAHLAHANLDYIFAIPSGGADAKSDNPLEKLTKAQIDEIKEQTLIKANNPYHQIKIDKASQIRIGQVRQIKNKLSRFGSSHTGRRVVIVSRADEMTTEASNAFLKTLEEPQENITIILTSARPAKILQTIHSRTQELTCSSLHDEFVIKKLMQEVACSEPEARIAAALGQGSYSTALASINNADYELRELPINLLRVAFKKNYYRTELLKHIETIAKYDKSDVAKLLNLMIFWLRDVYILSTNTGEDRIINIDQIEILRKFNTAYGKNDVFCGVKIVEEAINLIPRNINVRLILISMFIKLRAVFLYEKEEYEIMNTH